MKDSDGINLQVGDFANVYIGEGVSLAKVIGVVSVFDGENNIVVMEVRQGNNIYIEIMQYSGIWETLEGEDAEVRKLVKEDRSGVRVISISDVNSMVGTGLRR